MAAEVHSHDGFLSSSGRRARSSLLICIPEAWHQAFPDGSLARGRELLRQIHRLDLVDIDADAEVDIVRPGTPLAEFYRLSLAAIGPAALRAGAMSPDDAAALIDHQMMDDFLACGFVHIGVWGRRPSS